jgi:hypothetical protein
VNTLIRLAHGVAGVHWILNGELLPIQGDGPPI